MNIGEYKFIKVCNLSPELDEKGNLKTFMPQSRYLNQKSLPLNKYGRGPFCKFKIPRNYKTSGVYAIVADGEIKYIGECVNLSSRYNMGYGVISPRNCYKGGQETNCRINNLILQEASQGNQLSLWFFETDDYKKIEIKLLEKHNPEWNRT
jgi:hypothetical protein